MYIDRNQAVSIWIGEHAKVCNKQQSGSAGFTDDKQEVSHPNGRVSGKRITVCKSCGEGVLCTYELGAPPFFWLQRIWRAIKATLRRLVG